jgi:hypothetical protein
MNVLNSFTGPDEHPHYMLTKVFSEMDVAAVITLHKLLQFV